jgi:hypothetical protein
VEGFDGELQWPDMDQRQQLASTYDGIFHGCISISVVKEFEMRSLVIQQRKEEASVGRKKLIVLRRCLPWITAVIIFLFVTRMGRMTERCILVAPCTFRKVNINLMENFLLLMGHLMAMEDLNARTKIQVMIQQKTCLI